MTTRGTLQLIAMVAALSAIGCEDTIDAPACRKLEEHLISISPQYRAQLTGLSPAQQQVRLEQLVAAVPVEDLQQCVAADPRVNDCMQRAPDMAAVRACIPPGKKD